MVSLTDFQKELVQAARASFEHLKRSIKDENFYAFALYTDESAMTVVPAANSSEGFQEALGSMEITDEADIPWFKWSIAEWKYAAWKSDEFREISRFLRTSPDRSRFKAFYEQLLNDMTAALKQLDDEGYFGKGVERENIVLFISVSDSDNAPEIENNTAKLLNSTSVYNTFICRYDH